jgi:hypothetical protein
VPLDDSGDEAREMQAADDQHQRDVAYNYLLGVYATLPLTMIRSIA